MTSTEPLVAEFSSSTLVGRFCLALEAELERFSVNGAKIEAPSPGTKVRLSFDSSRGNEDWEVMKPSWRELVANHSGRTIER